MSRPIKFPTSEGGFAHLHDSFLVMAPHIVAHGEVFFRHLRCPGKKDDAICEMLALVWLWLLRLAQRGKDPTPFVSALARFAARRVRSGGRLTGTQKTGDVLSPWAQRVHGFAVKRLPELSTTLAEALYDNSKTPVPEAAAFRCDYPPWRASYTHRDQSIIDDLVLGERTSVVAARHGLSDSRISQKRLEFYQDWRRYCGDDEER